MAINHEGFLTRASFHRSYRRKVRRYLGALHGKALLDVGAGYGHFARAALEEGAQVDALEPRPQCHARLAALGVQSIDGATLEHSHNSRRYDVCAAITVLDEVEDKLRFLHHLRRHLKDSGTVLLEVRNLAYLRGFKRRHLATDVGEEVYLRLFEEAGLEVVRRGGAPRPLSFGDLRVFSKTLLANALSVVLPFYPRQMLIFVLKVKGVP